MSLDYARREAHDGVAVDEPTSSSTYYLHHTGFYEPHGTHALGPDLHVNPSTARNQWFVVVVDRWLCRLEKVVRINAGGDQRIPHGCDHGVRVAPDAREINVYVMRLFRCGSKREAEATVNRLDPLVALGAPFETECPSCA